MQPSPTPIITGHCGNDPLLLELLGDNALGCDLKLRKDRVKNYEIPPLSSKQIDVFTALLLKKIEILPGFNLPIWKVLRKIQDLIKQEGISSQDFLQCVGSAQARVLHSDPEYLKSLLENLTAKKLDLSSITEEQGQSADDIKDIDIRIHLPETDAGKNMRLRALLISWLAQEVFNHPPIDLKSESSNTLFGMISARINKKFCNPYEPNGNRFMLISLGDKTLSLDIVFEQHLTRTKILSPDDGQIPFNIVRLDTQEGACPIALTHLNFAELLETKMQDIAAPLIRPQPAKKIFKIILDRVFKIVHFPSMPTMDENGWFKLIHYYGQGYRSCEEEGKLIEIAISWAKDKAGSNEVENVAAAIAAKLLDFTAKHCAVDPGISLCYLFNAMMSLQRVGQGIYLPAIWKICREKCMPAGKNPGVLESLWPWLERNPENLGSIVDFLQCSALMHMNTVPKNASPPIISKPFLTFNCGRPAIQWQIPSSKGKTLCLITPFDIEKALPSAIRHFCNHAGDAAFAEQIWEDLLQGRVFQGPSLSLIRPYVEKLKLNPSFFLAQALACFGGSTPFGARLLEHINNLNESLESYLQGSAQNIDHTWGGLEAHAAIGFRPEQYSVLRPYILKLMKASLSVVGSDRGLLFNLIRIKRWLDGYPWIFDQDPAAKHYLLIQGIDRILKVIPGSKMGYQLAEHLHDFLRLLIEDYMQNRGNGPEKVPDVCQKICQVLAQTSYASCPLNPSVMSKLQESLPMMLGALHRQRKIAQLSEFNRVLSLREIQVPETFETTSALLCVYIDLLNKASLTEENLKKYRIFIDRLKSRIANFSAEEQEETYQFLETVYAKLLGRGHEDDASNLLLHFQDVHPGLHERCIALYFRHTQTTLFGRHELDKCYSVLTQEQWKPAREKAGETSRSFAEKVAAASLADDCKALAAKGIFALMRSYGIHSAALWKSFMARLAASKDKILIEEAWDYFVNTVLKEPASSEESACHVLGWLKGIQTLNRLCPAQLGECPKFYDHLRDHLAQCNDAALTEEVHLSLLKVYSQLSIPHRSDPKIISLFNELYQHDQSNPPITFEREIETSLIPILGSSNQPGHFQAACKKLLKVLSGAADLESQPSILRLIEGLLSRTSPAAGAERAEIDPLLIEIYDKASDERTSSQINWAPILEAFAHSENPDLLNRAVDRLGCLLMQSKEPPAQQALSKKTLPLTQETLKKLLSIAADEKNPFLDQYDDALFRLLFQIKSEDVHPIWLKSLIRRIDTIFKTPLTAANDKSFHSLCYILGHAPETVCTHPHLQKKIIGMISALVQTDVTRAAGADALFTHTSLGKSLDLEKNPFITVPLTFRHSASAVKLCALNSKSPYFKSHKFMEAYINFQHALLNRVLDDCKHLDLTRHDEAGPILEFIDSRLEYMIALCKGPANNPYALKVRQTVENFFDYLVVKPKCARIEKTFLRETIPNYWKHCEKLYDQTSRLTYNRYFVYLAMMSAIMPKKPGEKTPSTKFDPIVKGETIKWIVSGITRKMSGADICYASSIIAGFIRNGDLAADLNCLSECMRLVLSELKQGAGRLKRGQSIDAILSPSQDRDNLDTLLKLIPVVCAERLKNGSPEAAAQVSDLLVQVVLAGLALTAKAFPESRKDGFHPFIPCLQFFLDTKQMGFSNCTFYYQTLKAFPSVAVQEMKWSIENSCPATAERLRILMFSLLIAKGMNLADEDKKERADLMMEFILRISGMFQASAPHYHKMLELCEKTFALAKTADVLAATQIKGLSDHITHLKYLTK